MSVFAGRVTKRMLRRVGVFNGKPRIYNEDTGTYSVGYAEVNTQATSPIARIKVHKAWFVGDADVKEGDLILDRADNKRYLIMSLKHEVYGGEAAYIDGTLFWTNARLQILRFSPGNKDHFGREADASPEVIASAVWAMTNSMSINIEEQRDQPIPEEKIKVAIQAKYPVEEGDRLITEAGITYKVMSVDDTQLVGLWLLYVSRDTR